MRSFLLAVVYFLVLLPYRFVKPKRHCASAKKSNWIKKDEVPATDSVIKSLSQQLLKLRSEEEKVNEQDRTKKLSPFIYDQF